MPFFDVYSGLFCFGYNMIHVPKEKQHDQNPLMSFYAGSRNLEKRVIVIDP